MEYKAGMFIYALAFLSGVFLLQQFEQLPAISGLLVLLSVVSLLAVFVYRLVARNRPEFKIQYTLSIYFIVLFIIGIICATNYAAQGLQGHLPEPLAGKNILISGFISSIPVSDERSQRFNFQIENYHVYSTTNSGERLTDNSFPQNVRLSWYYARQQVHIAERWQFEVRLKPPHGFMNPGGFDYEAWLFRHGIQATGYIRQSADNKQLSGSQHFSLMSDVQRIRQSIGQLLDRLAQSSTAADNSDTLPPASEMTLVKALAIGDKSSMSADQWRVLANTGTGHLMAISGLHIGLASLFAYFIIRRSLPLYIVKRLPAQQAAIAGGLLLAGCYALIAGLSVSTQRAVIMLFVLSMMLLARRNYRPFDGLGCALLVVLFFDPLAVLSAGFWFSFLAVAVIFTGIQHRDAAVSQQPNNGNVKVRDKVISAMKQWMRIQILITAFLLPLSLIMFQQVSLVSPLVNFVFIPYVSFLVVPVVLLAICCSFIAPGLAEALFVFAAYTLKLVWPLLSYISALPFAVWVKGDAGAVSLLAVWLSMLLVYYAKPIACRITTRINRQAYISAAHVSLLLLAMLLLIPVITPGRQRIDKEHFQLAVLDVGQGTAVVVQTKNHVLVYDAGARYSERLDSGRHVVIPYLRYHGIQSPDYLLISHGDADHIGGAQSILDEYPAMVVIGRDIDILRAREKHNCVAGMNWQWDGVFFEFLSPAKESIASISGRKRNNHSCVLRVHSPSGSILLTGDIEKPVEDWLVKKYASRLAADILLVPHHGSKTSSSKGFIAAVSPAIAIFTVGYKNRYRFPAESVISRYGQYKSELMQTDKTGAIEILFNDDGKRNVMKYRETARRYWHYR